MKLLIALLAAAVGAFATASFLRRRNHSWDATWNSAKDTASHWGHTAADEASKAADIVSDAADRANHMASNVADQIKDGLDISAELQHGQESI
jgi:hypothetical protein